MITQSVAHSLSLLVSNEDDKCILGKTQLHLHDCVVSCHIILYIFSMSTVVVEGHGPYVVCKFVVFMFIKCFIRNSWFQIYGRIFKIHLPFNFSISSLKQL